MTINRALLALALGLALTACSRPSAQPVAFEPVPQQEYDPRENCLDWDEEDQECEDGEIDFHKSKSHKYKAKPSTSKPAYVASKPVTSYRPAPRPVSTPTRSYSAPSRPSYSAPSRPSYSAPARSSSYSSSSSSSRSSSSSSSSGSRRR